MSFHLTPDPHPGRCKNYRQGAFNPNTYQYSFRRCLEMDSTVHVCRFEPEKPPTFATMVGWSGSGGDASGPTPWVVPPVEEVSDE